jgi:hypothetical protein
MLKKSVCNRQRFCLLLARYHASKLYLSMRNSQRRYSYLKFIKNQIFIAIETTQNLFLKKFENYVTSNFRIEA